MIRMGWMTLALCAAAFTANLAARSVTGMVVCGVSALLVVVALARNYAERDGGPG